MNYHVDCTVITDIVLSVTLSNIIFLYALKSILHSAKLLGQYSVFKAISVT